MITGISELPDEHLARLFFKKLWQGYDSGGVSMCRSLRSTLVEVYLAIQEDGMTHDPPVGPREIAEEAERRTPTAHNQMLLGNIENLSLLPSILIALLCIDGLHNWYNIHRGEEGSEGYIANPIEGKFIGSVHRIMPIPFFPGLNSDTNIKMISRIGMERVGIKSSGP